MKITSTQQTNLTTIQPSEPKSSTPAESALAPAQDLTQTVEGSVRLATSLQSENSLSAATLRAQLNKVLTKESPITQLEEQLKGLKETADGLKQKITALTGQIGALELAVSLGSGDPAEVLHAKAELAQLQAQLAKVQLEIQEVLVQIEQLRSQEEQSAEEKSKSIEESLSKAVESRAQAWKAITNLGV
jgi:chromosome segregation ATPase